MSEDLFSPFDPLNGKPVTIVFGSFNYRRTIHEWIQRAVPLCNHWRIICLDREIISWLNKIGRGSCAIYFYDLFPGMQEHNLAKLDNKSRKKIIFTLRQNLFRAIAESGRDFVHSDADALWLQDPRPWLMQHTEFDILISQGTYAPREHFQRYHFVLCAGFFFCRANKRTQNYFRQVEATKWALDQKSMNEVLLADPKARWELHRPRIWWNSVGRLAGPWRKVPVLVSSIWMLMRRIAPKWTRRVENRSLKKSNYPEWLKDIIRYYIYVSPEIIKGSFSKRLTIGVIPMHLIPRIEPISSTSSWVVHLRSNIRK